VMAIPPPPASDWADNERAEIRRLEQLCDASQDWLLECSHTDVGDPWCIIYDQQQEGIILHIARIDRQYVVVWPREQRSTKSTIMAVACVGRSGVTFRLPGRVAAGADHSMAGERKCPGELRERPRHWHRADAVGHDPTAAGLIADRYRSEWRNGAAPQHLCLHVSWEVVQLRLHGLVTPAGEVGLRIGTTHEFRQFIACVSQLI
jgi:hypothetical protein